jgi:hypothetical protein
MMSNSLLVKCPMCSETRKVSYEAYRKMNKRQPYDAKLRIPLRACNRHAKMASRSEYFYDIPFTENFLEEEKEILVNLLIRFGKQTSVAKYLGVSNRTVCYLVELHSLHRKPKRLHI